VRYPCDRSKRSQGRHSTPRPVDRRGFILLTVLWVSIAVGAIGVSSMLVVSAAMETARNRVNLVRASWIAEGCLEAARAETDAALMATGDSGTAWLAIDSVLVNAPLLRGTACIVGARAEGATLNVNSAEIEDLRRLLAAVLVPGERRDSLVDALLDWRDIDDEAHASGAESSWYQENGLLAPRDGPLLDPDEIKHVRGYSDIGGVDSLLGTDAARIPLGRAPLPVLATLPGFTEEVLARLEEMRERNTPPRDLAALAAVVSPAARDSIRAHYSLLAQRLTADPEAWIITSRSSSGQPSVVSTVEVRLIRVGTHAALVRRRSWP
jgi:type II secretory pathway component PulK